MSDGYSETSAERFQFAIQENSVEFNSNVIPLTGWRKLFYSQVLPDINYKTAILADEDKHISLLKLDDPFLEHVVMFENIAAVTFLTQDGQSGVPKEDVRFWLSIRNCGGKFKRVKDHVSFRYKERFMFVRPYKYDLMFCSIFGLSNGM
jgi:hypothetical protein